MAGETVMTIGAHPSALTDFSDIVAALARAREDEVGGSIWIILFVLFLNSPAASDSGERMKCCGKCSPIAGTWKYT